MAILVPAHFLVNNVHESSQTAPDTNSSTSLGTIATNNMDEGREQPAVDAMDAVPQASGSIPPDEQQNSWVSNTNHYSWVPQLNI